ncbi:MAG: hypothetical protein ABH834_08035 [Candidatus Altiarchaeota archaeon]
MRLGSRGQSAIEWLITHSWSILLVLCVSAVLFYAGVFEATARPRFEGLASSGVQPVSEQVQLYSDGVLVFTVLNTRPYPIRLEWVEVAPIADRDDVVRTDIGELIASGDVGVFNVNASNLVSVVGASVFFMPIVSAAGQFVDFIICWNESYIAGGKSSSRVVCGKAFRITHVSEPYHSEPEACTGICNCPCTSDVDCPDPCQVCMPDSCSWHPCYKTCYDRCTIEFECFGMGDYQYCAFDPEEAEDYPEGRCWIPIMP